MHCVLFALAVILALGVTAFWMIRAVVVRLLRGSL
jgi:hypothetical protein